MSSDYFHHDVMKVRVQLLISQMQENTQRLQALERENQQMLAENQELQNGVNSQTIVRLFGDASTSQPVPFDQAAHTTYYAPVRPDEHGTTTGDINPILASTEPNIQPTDGAHAIARHTVDNPSNRTGRHRSDDMARATQEVPPISTPNGNVGLTQLTIPLQGTPSGPSHSAPLNSSLVNTEPTLANRDLA
ncbi:hypothetical protein ACOSQ3_019646 [Xanthoceras sorbifolium]